MLTETLISLLQTWVSFFLMGYKLWGFVCGFSLIAIWLLRQSRLWVLFSWLAVMSAAIAVPLLVALPDMTEMLGGKKIQVPRIFIYWFVGGLVTPAICLFLLSRYGGQLGSWIAAALTKPFGHQRLGRTDVRTISDALPGALQGTYDPELFFRPKKGIFLGLNERKKPIYLSTSDWRSSHCQIFGTTGSGKGVAAGVLLAQSAQQGEAVVVIDP